MMPGSKGHAFHVHMEKHDTETPKTPKRSHFSREKNAAPAADLLRIKKDCMETIILNNSNR